MRITANAMFRTAAIAVVATFVGGAASPVGSYLRIIGHGPPLPVAYQAEPAMPRSAPSDGLRLTRADDGLFHAPVLVNGRRASLIVDTGATVTVLTGADAARLGVARLERDATTLQTAGGASAMRWARVRTLRIAGHDLTDLDVAVVDAGLAHSLLGQDVLGGAGVLRVEGPHMEIR